MESIGFSNSRLIAIRQNPGRRKDKSAASNEYFCGRSFVLFAIFVSFVGFLVLLFVYITRFHLLLILLFLILAYYHKQNVHNNPC